MLNIEKYGIQVQHPDDFILNLITRNSELVCQAFKNQLFKKFPNDIRSIMRYFN